jgi:hypothetical protein
MNAYTLFWIYLLNVSLLIMHEMDSAYWREWELLGLPGGAGGFMLLHFPLLLVILYGLILVWQGAPAGLILSLVLSLAGVFAFVLHTYFIRRGRSEFKTSVSLSILAATLLASLVQAGVTLALLIP